MQVANAYMNRQYLAIGVVGLVLFAVLLLALDWGTAVGFDCPPIVYLLILLEVF